MLRFLLWYLKRPLSSEKRMVLMNQILSTVGALPVHSIITVDDANKLCINGKPLEYEQAVLLRESALNVLRSPAYGLVREQVLYQAVSKGIHEALNHDQILFGKAAIWFGQQEMELLKVLAQEAGNSPLSGD